MVARFEMELSLKVRHSGKVGRALRARLVGTIQLQILNEAAKGLAALPTVEHQAINR